MISNKLFAYHQVDFGQPLHETIFFYLQIKQIV